MDQVATTAGPFVSVRLATTDDRGTRRTDLTLRGERGVATSDSADPFDFDAADAWTVVRRLLPRLAPMRTRPEPTRVAGPVPAADLADLPDRARGFAAIVVAVGDDRPPESTDGTEADDGEVVSVRSWLATEDALYAVPPAGGTPTRMAAGAVADHLIWDLTGALELLSRRPPATAPEGMAS